jgi:ADP-heptose:LPS heptosyltransferase
MTSPLLRELNRSLPDARISLIVGPHALGLVEECPYIDRAITYRPMAVDRWWHPLSRLFHSFLFARRHLWSRPYDLAIMPRWGPDYYDSSVLTYFSGAKWRIGYSEEVEDRKRTQNRGYDRFYTQVIDDRSIRHEVERNVDLLSALGLDPLDGPLELWLSHEDDRFAAAVIAPVTDHPLFALGPGAGSKKRTWPLDRFLRLAEWLVGERGAGIVVLGGPGEESLGRLFQEAPFGGSVINLVNKATLREAGAVLRRCRLFCGNDSGTMHLAAAAGIPVVEVSCHPVTGDQSHPNSPERFGPWGVPHRILRPEPAEDGCRRGCRSREPHCIEKVSIDTMMQAIETVISAKPASSRGNSYG